MANLDELQIKITASSKEADEAIKSLTNSLNSLNDAIGRLDGSKVNSFASAIGKLSNIGANTSTTAKAIKGMASDLSSSFGIRTKKGVEEVTAALQALYAAARNKNLNDSPENDNVFWNSVSGLQKAIEENYRYKESVDETSKSIAEYIRIQNQSGRKVAMGDMAKEYGEDFKAISNALGKSFKNHLKSTEGAQDLAEFFNDMNSTLHTSFKTDSPEALKESLESLIAILDSAKEKTYKFSEAVSSEMLSGSEAADAAYSIIDRIFALIKEQDKYGASSGLGSLVEVFKQIGNIQMPDMSGVADALKAAQTASNNVSSSSPKVEEVAKAMDTISQSASNATSNANELGNALMVISQGFLATTDNTTSLQVVEQALPALREMSNFQPPDMSTAIEQFNEYADAIYRALAGMRALEDKRPGLPDKYYDPIDTTGEWVSNNPPDLYTAVDSYAKMQQAAEGARAATERLGDSIKLITDKYNEPIDTNGAWVVDPSQIGEGVDDVIKQGNAFEDAADKAKDAAEKMDEAKGKASGNVSGDVLENVVALGEAFEKLGSKLDAMGDKGIKLFKTLTKPLQWAAEEYKEKFQHMGEIVAGFQANFKAHMAKIAQFWKRTMKTFTFMLVRKAITAIIKEVGNAVQSLAMYSNAMGTAFNTDISNMVADFQFLGRSIVSVFAPLLSYIAPIIDAIVAKIATLLSYIGMLIAALGGSTSFTKAKKNVGNYADSLDKASKSAKNLTMGIDELNILSESGGGGGSKPFDGWADAWEDVEIPEWILKLSDKLKKLWDDLTAPLKEAWARVKENFLLAWQTMISKLKAMFKAIGKAFLEVWNEEKTIQTIQKILNGVANLMHVVGNLAENFTKAWEENKRGVQIFEKMRDIVYVLATHFENLTAWMYFWSQGVTFDKLLDSVIQLLTAFEKLADFIGGVFYDVMTRVVLKYIEWMIEEGLPHLNETISEIIDKFNFDKIRKDLQPLEDALLNLIKNIHTGTTNAFGNLGKMVAEFANSQEFTDFMQRIADIMGLLSKEDVEKILTGIGEGILSIAESVVKFVNSESFMKFLEAIDKWLENASTEDIAGIVKGLATAIGAFEFAAFASSGFAGFLQFAVILKSFKNLETIAAGFKGVGAGASTASSGIGAFLGSLGTVIGIIAYVAAAIYSLIESFGGVDETLQYISGVFDIVAERLKRFAERLNISEHIDNLKTKFSDLLSSLGNLRHYWEIMINVVGLLADAIGGILLVAFDSLARGLSGIIEFVTGVIEVFGGFFDALWSIGEVIVGLVNNDLPMVSDGFNDLMDAFQRISEGIDLIWKGLVDSILGVIGGLASGLFNALVGMLTDVGVFSEDWEKEIKAWWDEKVEPWFTYEKWAELFQSIKDALGGIITSLGEFVTQWVTTIENWWNNNVAPWFTFEKWAELGRNIINGLFGGIKERWENAAEDSAIGKWLIEKFKNDTDEHSPSKKAYELGDFFIQGLLKPFTENKVDELSVFTTAFLNVFKTNLSPDKFSDIGTSMIQGLLQPIGASTGQFAEAVNQVFVVITQTIGTNMDILGVALTEMMTTFIQTFIVPFTTLEIWQPVFDMFLESTFVPLFEQFRAWFMEEAMTPWWEEDLLSWFADDKWNEEIFTPLQENIQSNWDVFSSWWDTSMTAWWEEQVLPWFDKPRWEEQFNKILEVVKKVFELIKQAIKIRIDEAKEAVIEACEEMKNAIEEVITAIDIMMEKLAGFDGFNGDITFSFGAKEFASGGFPAYGSLFVAGEPGAGTEWVGNVGGRTGVVSNNEITGIADAVYATGNAETELLGQLLTIGRAMLDKDPIVINDKDIARMANRGQNQLGMSIIS